MLGSTLNEADKRVVRGIALDVIRNWVAETDGSNAELRKAEAAIAEEREQAEYMKRFEGTIEDTVVEQPPAACEDEVIA